MENVTLDRTTVLQLDADSTDRALDAAADGNVLRDDTALDLRAIADQKIRGAQLTLDLAEDLRWTIAFDIADDRHAGADARACPRLRHRFAPCRVLNDRVLRLHGLCHDFFQICRRALIPLRCFALEHVHLPFSPAFSAERPKLSSRDRARADAEPFTPPRGGPSGLGRHLRIGLRKADLPPRWSRRLPAILCTEPCQGFDF